jgi:hypothetical protein
MASTPDTGTERPQPWARPFVAVLLAAFVTCGVLGIEAWPLSGFRLFSAPRGAVTTGWRLIAVTADGERVRINVSRLGAAYRGFGFVARSFEDLTPPERAAVCGVWLRAAASIGIDAARLMLVKVEQLLEPRDQNGPLTEPRRTTEATCSAGTAG